MFKKCYFDPGSRQSRFGGFFGGPSGIVVGSVVSKSRRWREERANARDEREVTVYGNSLRSANNPLCNRLRNQPIDFLASVINHHFLGLAKL